MLKGMASQLKSFKVNPVASNIGLIKKMTSQLKFKSNHVDFF